EVTHMSYMFYECSSLTSLDLSSFDTSKVEFMNEMFPGCLNLKTLNLSSFSFTSCSNVENMLGRDSKNEIIGLGIDDTKADEILNKPTIDEQYDLFAEYISEMYGMSKEQAKIFLKGNNYLEMELTNLTTIIAPTTPIDGSISIALSDTFYAQNNLEGEGYTTFQGGTGLVLVKKSSAVPSTGVAINFAIFGVISLASLFAIALSFAFNKKSKRYVKK
ncbi:MAG: BspA family leucine-rich repeat surface protein, partial [Christensenellales bacterium]